MMDYAKSVIFKILSEGVGQDKIIDAIKKRHEVKIKYTADDDPKGTGERMIQPVAYGTSKAGNPVIRAWQPNGDTKTRIPHWKLFRVDRIDNWKAYPKRKFKTPPDDPNQPAFNKNGDKTMSQVFVIADFDSAEARYKRGGLERYNIQRRQSTPYGGLRANINRSYRSDVADRNISQEQPKDSNYWSTYDMALSSASIDNDDNVVSQTVSPVLKGSENNPVSRDTKKLDYRNVDKNGPVYKDDNDEGDTEDLFNYVDDEQE